jgi:thioesterase domain-containing protein
VEFSIRALFETPTVAGLAQRMSGGAVPDPLEVLLPLRPYGNRPALFCMHPLGGLSWCYSGLLQHIPPEYPLYGLQARGMNAPEALPESLEEMANDYVERICATQATGPYHLVGWSLGGLIAYAAACQLQQQGHQVGLLALLDAYPPSGNSPLPFPDMQTVLAGLMKDLGRERHGEEPLEVATVMEFLRRDGDALSTLRENQIRNMYEVARNNHLLVSNFTPSRYYGDLLLFTATADRTGDEPPPQAWEPYVMGETHVHPIPCRHQLMTEPQSLSRVGAVLRVQLELMTRTDPYRDDFGPSGSAYEREPPHPEQRNPS